MDNQDSSTSRIIDSTNTCLDVANSKVSSQNDDAGILMLISENSINTEECSLDAIDDKRAELESTQTDLDNLMLRINKYIAESANDCISISGDSVSSFRKIHELPENELSEHLVAVPDCQNSSEYNWEDVGLILQQHVSDLQRLHNLNQMTNAVVKRIRKLTQISDAIIKENKKKHTSM